MINQTPLVSIIIPVYNREDIIEETLSCALNQTYQNIEVVITDNCSTDNTWNVLQEFANKDKRIKLFQNETNLGPVKNWKAAIDKTSGEYIKILWSDDLITLDFIEKCISSFDDDTAFVLTGVKIFDGSEDNILFESSYQEKQIYSKDEYLEDVLIYNKKGFPVSPGCALFRAEDIRTSYVEQIPNEEGLDFKRYGAGNDLLFFLITINKHQKIKTIKSASSLFRSHATSLTKSNDLDIYYEYSKLFFIQKYNDRFITLFKSKIVFKLLKNAAYKTLIKVIDKKTSYLSMMRYLFFKAFG